MEFMLHLSRAVVLLHVVLNPALTNVEGTKCMQVTSICTSLGYDTAVFPNSLGHSNAEEAELHINRFYPLINVKCSESMKRFLCLVHFPPCGVTRQILPPCRELCLKARKGCGQLMKMFGFDWPELLNCDKFPTAMSTDECYMAESGNLTSTAPTASSEPLRSDHDPPRPKHVSPRSDHDPPRHDTTEPSTTITSTRRCMDVGLMCRDQTASMGYMTAVFPNWLGHATSEEAHLEVHQFMPVVQKHDMECSAWLMDFVCFSYFPPCVLGPDLQRPCKELCQAAKLGCEPVMNQMGFSWPSKLSCEQFLSRKSSMCYMREMKDIPTATTVKPTTAKTPAKNKRISFRKFLSVFRKSVGQLSRDLDVLRDALDVK